jgi:hypothetical protein
MPVCASRNPHLRDFDEHSCNQQRMRTPVRIAKLFDFGNQARSIKVDGEAKKLA